MYCYGLVRTREIEPIETMPDGIEGLLCWVICGEIAALVERNFGMVAGAFSEAELLTAIVGHDRVLRSVFQTMTVLPLRFGTEFTTEVALQEHFKQNLSDYLRKLTALENKAEISLTLTAIAPAEVLIPAHLTGRDYFLARKEQSQQQLQWQADCDRIRQQAVDLLAELGGTKIRILRGIAMCCFTIDRFRSKLTVSNGDRSLRRNLKGIGTTF